MNQAILNPINPEDFISDTEYGLRADWEKVHNAVKLCFDCDCEHWELYQRKQSNDVIVVGRVCVRCFLWRGVSKRGVNLETLPWYDSAWRDNYQSRRIQMRDRILTTVSDYLENRREEEREQYTKQYRAYLQSPEWREKRNRVMRRAGGRCEGCGERSATEVHHKTYDRVFDEMLFDLVAVCSPCHRKFHKDKY